MRCPGCEKFVSLEMGDPEVQDSNVDTDGTVTITVRIVRTCADCGEEMKEATLEMTTTPTPENLNGHVNRESKVPLWMVTFDGVDHAEGDGHREREVECEDEPTQDWLQKHLDESVTLISVERIADVFHDLQIEVDNVEPIEEGGGRYKKSYFGAEVSFRVTCTCDEHEKDRWSFDGTVNDKVSASGMDELV